MILKKAGKLLLVRLRLFELAAKIAIFPLLASIFLVFVVHHGKEKHKFQQPSLHTKLFDIQRGSNAQLIYHQIYNGIKAIVIKGLMTNQCLLITYPAQFNQHNELKSVYKTLHNHRSLPKNIVMLSYNSLSHLQQFMNWYHEQRNTTLDFGIIRAGINIQLYQTQQKQRAYFHIYGKSVYPDVDYYLAVKELMENLHITWLPCEATQKPVYKAVRRALLKVADIVVEKEISYAMLVNQLICQFNEHVTFEDNAHDIHMQNGFQSSTVKLFLVKQSKLKAAKLLVSFVKQFSVQQDHLHSSDALYYPITREHFIALKMIILPSVVFLIACVVILIDMLIKDAQKIVFKLPLLQLGFVYGVCWEYCLTGNIKIVMLGLVVLFGRRAFGRVGVIEQCEMFYIRTALIVFEALVALYFGFFDLSLSLVGILLGIVMMMNPNSTRLRQYYNAVLMITLGYLTVYLSSFDIVKLWQNLEALSLQLTVVLIPFIINCSL